MNTSGARIQCDMLTQDDQRIALHHWMTAAFALQCFRIDFGDHRVIRNAENLQCRFDQFACQYKNFIAAHINSCIFKLGMQRDGQIGRKCPGRGGPDDHIDRFSFQHRIIAAEIILHAKFYKNRRRGFVLIFNFRFSQRRLTVKAPINGLLAAIKASIAGKLAAFSSNDGFIFIVHGQVRMFPIPHHTQTPKLIALNINKFFGILSAEPADIG